MSTSNSDIVSILSPVWVKVLVWAIPVVFGAGGIYASVSQSKAEVRDLKKGLELIKDEVSSHKNEGVGHQSTKTRLHRIEAGQIRIITRQQIQSENIAAICQATKARCK